MLYIFPCNKYAYIYVYIYTHGVTSRRATDGKYIYLFIYIYIPHQCINILIYIYIYCYFWDMFRLIIEAFLRENADKVLLCKVLFVLLWIYFIRL